MSSIVLRPYQGASIEGLRQGFRDGHDHQILSASTGSGKSIIALSMLEAAIAKGSRVMFICDRRVLVDQFSRHLDAHRIDHGCYMSGHWRYRPEAKIQVASIQTLERMDSWPAADLIVVDEIHAVMRTSLKNFLDKHPKIRVIGMTATPFHPDLGRYFTAVTNVITMSELVDQGFLVPFRVFVATEIDTAGVKVVAGEWKQDDLEERGLRVVGNVVADYVRISNDVFGGPRKTICFTAGVAHGAALAESFAEVGLNFVQISYKDDEDYKKQVLEDFAKPDTLINGVISSEILTRGFDQTDVEHIIIAKPLRKAFSMHVQIIGRGARTHEGKEFCVIQDNSGNWLRFQDDWEKLYVEGAKTLDSDLDTKTRAEKTAAEKEAAKCPGCGKVWHPAHDICPYCGHVRVRRNLVETVAGEMSELGIMHKKEKYSPEYKADFYAQLLGWTVEKGKKPGLAFYRYIDKFGVQPSMAKPAPAPPGPEVLRWIRSRNIAYANRRSA